MTKRTELRIVPAPEKEARAAGLPRGHVPLLVNGKDIGRTTREPEEGETSGQKVADSEPDDTGAILERLFPAAVKSATAAVPVSPDYPHPPDWYAEKRSEAGRAELVAALAAATPLPREPAWAPQVAAAIDRATRAAAEALREPSVRHGAVFKGVVLLHGGVGRRP
jgi:hypothetical protein